MSSLESRNLILIDGGKNKITELHLNPWRFKPQGLRSLLLYQLYSDSTEIVLKTPNSKYILSENTLRNVREKSKDEIESFLYVTTNAMRDSDEIIIIVKNSRKKIKKPRVSHSPNHVKNFINDEHSLTQLD